jgi:hypothetical protein
MQPNAHRESAHDYRKGDADHLDSLEFLPVGVIAIVVQVTFVLFMARVHLVAARLGGGSGVRGALSLKNNPHVNQLFIRGLAYHSFQSLANINDKNIDTSRVQVPEQSSAS